MAKREPLSTQLLHDAVWSKDIGWTVCLTCDNRGNVTRVQTTASYGRGPDYLFGHAAENVAPFDDLPDIIGATMLDAALTCSDQLTLFPRP